MKRARVLLAEDNRRVAQELTRILTGEFELLGTVEDGLALIEAATTLGPDVIVTDVSMPLFDGLDALAQLKKANPDVKVILITMYQDAAFVSFALQAGALGFVLKHSALDELVPAVRAVLDGKTYISPAVAAKADGRA